MNTYRCRHTVEAAQWHDTDENREAFTTWFEKHDAMFETRGPIVVLPEEGEVPPGDWILLFDDGEFVAMTDDEFRTEYEQVSARTLSPEQPTLTDVRAAEPAWGELPEGSTVGTSEQFVHFSIGWHDREYMLRPREADKLADLLHEAARKVPR